MRHIVICCLSLFAAAIANAESVVDPSVAFLLQRQEADGSWNDRTHHLIAPVLPEDSDGSSRSAIFTTGLVIRALLTEYVDPTQNQAVLIAIARGTDYLCRQQQDDGQMSDDIVDQAVATHALRLFNKAGIQPPIGSKAKLAMDYLLSKQRLPCAWSKTDQDPQHIDLWAGFWCLQALGSARPNPPSEKLFSGWWDMIGDRASKERADGGFPANFIFSPDGSWSHDPKAPDGSAVALFYGEHPQVRADRVLVSELRKRLSTAMVETVGQAPVNWPQRLALSMTEKSAPGKAWSWMAHVDDEMVKEGPVTGSWPATGSDLGRISATAYALIVRRKINDQLVTDRVREALEFFHRHANTDGGWNDRISDGEAQHSSISTTALVTLCFLGAGYDHKTPNRFKKSVEAGLLYLRKTPDLDQLSTLELAMVTMTLAEAYAMTNDPTLKFPSSLNLHRLLSRRTDLPGSAVLTGAWGSDHLKAGFHHDTWTSMWCCMAMKSGLAGGLFIGDGLDRTGRWLDHLGGQRTPEKQLHFPAHGHWDATGQHQYHGRAEAAALWIAFLTAHKPDEPLVQQLVEILLVEEIPKWETKSHDIAKSYIMMVGMFLSGGSAWESVRHKWSGLKPAIDTSELLAGSLSDDHTANGIAVGRITATAYFTLANEVFYRYLQVSDCD